MKFKQYINIPGSVSVNLLEDVCSFAGPKGNVEYKIHKFIDISLNESTICLSVKDSILKKRDLILVPALFNTTYVMFKNCIYGVVNLFEYFLVLKGVGYKVSYDNKISVLTMLLGYSHPINLNVPKDIFIEVPNNSELIIKSVSKSKAGQFASDIRALKAPEIYKGNGIRYKDENIILKVPKKTK